MNRMFICTLAVSILLSLHAPFSYGDVKPLPAAQSDSCPVDLDLTSEEFAALIRFNANLTRLNRYYGTPQFQPKLAQTIATEWPTKKVIEVSPTFLEQTLNLVDQQYLRDSIAETIGLDSRDWQAFERVMARVTLKEGMTENRFGAFTKISQQLIDSIKQLSVGQAKNKSLVDQTSLDVAKARAISRITGMVVYLERWSVINKQIAQQRAQDTHATLTMTALGLTAVGIMGASILYSGVIIDAAAVYGASLVNNPVASAIMSRVAQTIAIGGLGGAGAPVGRFLVDTTASHFNAVYEARTKDTLYVCELDKQIKAWKKAGATPYLHAVVLGFAVGAGGNLLTYIPKVGALAVHLPTTGLVIVSQAKPILDTLLNNSESREEHQKAMTAFFEKGNRQEAVEHLKKSLALSHQYHQDFLQVIVMATLSHAYLGSFKAALLEGDRVIRALYANSADTIPQAVTIASDIGKKKDKGP